jgi:hypothetical protein
VYSYTLENFPSLRTMILEKRAEFCAQHGESAKTVSMLTGDFLMPYLLSTVDKGKGMMTMLNETPIDYVTWGNHESDMAHSDVLAREKEYQGVWVNSNMKTHESYASSTCQTDEAWIELPAADGSHSRKVAMIGVLTNTSSKPTAFNGAKIDDPWECMAAYKPKLEAAGAELVIPLCHLCAHPRCAHAHSTRAPRAPPEHLPRTSGTRRAPPERAARRARAEHTAHLPSTPRTSRPNSTRCMFRARRVRLPSTPRASRASTPCTFARWCTRRRAAGRADSGDV